MDVRHLCADLVRIRSENPPGDTHEAIEYIAGFLEGLGIKATITQNEGGRSNLVVNDPSHSLLLCGHVDVVPALAGGWSHDPFGGDIESGYVWGRGATDMKGGCAAILAAVAASLDDGIDPRINLAFVCDEETGGEYGIRHLLSRKLLSRSDCLIAEPTPSHHPAIGQKGLCRLRLEFTGEPGHGSLYPHVGVSAIMEAFALIEYLKILNSREFDFNKDLEPVFYTSSGVLEKIYGIGGIKDVLRRITFNPGRIEGGEKANVVAQQCTLDLDMRVPWGCDVEKLVAGIAAHAPRARITPLNLAAPSYTPPDSAIVQATCEEITRVHGVEAAPIVQWAASDARYLRQAGFDVLEYGPGEIPTLHAIDERVAVHDLERAADIYQGLIKRYSERGKPGKKS